MGIEHLTPEDIRRAYTDRLGRPSTNVKKLAKEHSELAMERLVQLMFSGNDCAALGAVRSVLERGGGRVPAGTPKHFKTKLDQGIHVTIKDFREAREDGGDRDHELPMVYGGWQGPRDLSVPCGPGLPSLRGKRAREARRAQDHGGAATHLPGAGGQAGAEGGMSAARAKRSGAKTKRDEAEKE